MLLLLMPLLLLSSPGSGSLEDVADCYRTLEGRGYRRLTPHFIPR